MRAEKPASAPWRTEQDGTHNHHRHIRPSQGGFLQNKIKTLILNLAKITLESVTSDYGSAPTFRVFANGVELSAA